MLPEKIRAAAERIAPSLSAEISELRLRRGRCFTAVISGKEYYITKYGELSRNAEDTVYVADTDIDSTFKTAFRGSVHAFPRELAEGFITCGGNRVGFCGSAVLDKQYGITAAKDISSINIRIAHEVKGCAEELYDMAFCRGFASLIIASPPCGGKTTILRDLCRVLRNRYKVSLIDERGELAASEKGIPQNDIGEHTDVFCGYPKHTAIMTAVRVMSPDIIICDEIGAPNDLEALSFAANSGVRLICTCHSPSVADLKCRPVAGELIKAGAFSYAAILGTGEAIGKITGFCELDNTALSRPIDELTRSAP